MNPKKHNRRRQPVHLSLLISHRRALLVGIGQIAQSRLWSPEKANTNANKRGTWSDLAAATFFLCEKLATLYFSLNIVWLFSFVWFLLPFSTKLIQVAV